MLLYTWGWKELEDNSPHNSKQLRTSTIGNFQKKLKKWKKHLTNSTNYNIIYIEKERVNLSVKHSKPKRWEVNLSVKHYHLFFLQTRSNICCERLFERSNDPAARIVPDGKPNIYSNTKKVQKVSKKYWQKHCTML